MSSAERAPDSASPRPSVPPDKRPPSTSNTGAPRLAAMRALNESSVGLDTSV